MAERSVSPSQVGQYLKGLMDYDGFLSRISVVGEISGYRKYPSGHHYFSLKDPQGVLACVLFKADGQKLTFTPEEGQQVLAQGSVTVYPRDGKYQLICRSLRPQGVGDLHQAYEALKEKLQQEGLFAQEHKKPLPPYPKTVALVTSPAGAVVQDMIRILTGRYPLAKILVVPVNVQGQGAAQQIAAAIAWVDGLGLADVMIVGRGGGSKEELWTFQEEVLVRAVFKAKTPIVSAVGHEPDVSLCDFVADLRAATPTHAAELVVPDQEVLAGELAYYQEQLQEKIGRHLGESRRHLHLLASSPALRDPGVLLREKAQQLDHCGAQLQEKIRQQVSEGQHHTRRLAATLHALSPLAVLGRGFAIPRSPQGDLLRSVGQIAPGDLLTVHLQDGQVDCLAEAIRQGPQKTK